MKKLTTYAFVFCQILGLLALQSVAADKAKAQSDAKRPRVVMTTDFPPIGVVKDGSCDPCQRNALVRKVTELRQSDAANATQQCSKRED